MIITIFKNLDKLSTLKSRCAVLFKKIHKIHEKRSKISTIISQVKINDWVNIIKLKAIKKINIFYNQNKKAK